MNRQARSVRGLIIVATIATVVALAPIWAGGTPSDQLFMPQGSAAGTANGDYLSTPTGSGGAQLPYRYWIEVPAGASRLVVDLFDPDWGAGGTTEAASNRDRDRGGTTFGGVSTYSLIDPAGTTVATQTSTDLAAFDNTWATIYDSLPSITGVTTNTTGGATSLSVTVPAGGAGDLLVAVVSKLNQNAVTLTGWTALAAASGNCAATCRQDVFYRTSIVGTPAAAFSWTGSVKATGAVYRVAQANLTPTGASGSGTSTTPTAPVLAGTGDRLILRLAGAADDTFSAAPPAGHVTDFTLAVGGDGTDVGGAGASQTINGAAATAAFTLTTNVAWAAATVGISAASTPTAGHWELRVDNTASGSNDINAIGMRAHDGNSGAGGTEYPFYFDSHTQIGANTEVGANTGHLYDLFPYITSGCTAQESDFDYDRTNGTGGGPGGIFGQIILNSRTGAFTQTISTTLAVDNAWASTQINRWTTDQSSTGNGIWPSTMEIWPYSGGNSNYANIYFRNVPASAAPPPTANPTPDSFRVYLAADGGGTPVKPYLEQLITWVSGPNPPATGVQSIYRVTVRLVNPTAQAITFSTPNNIVTANIPGAGAVYGGTPLVSQGTVVTQPTVGLTGNITWNPGSVAAGSTQLLSYLVRVTPPSAGSRVVATGTPASNGTRAQYLDETGNSSQARATYLFGPICELAITQGLTTRALVTGLRAFEERGQVAVEWTTTTEDGTAGFDLYRWNAAKNDWDLVNAELVMAAPDSVQGGRYRVIDAAAPTGVDLTYAVMEAEGKGTSRLAGTFTVRPEVASKERSLFTGDRMAERIPTAASPRELALLSAAAERAASAGAAELEEMLAGNRRPTSGSRLRIRIQDAGLYRLTASDLATRFGVSVATASGWISAGQLRLENRGQVVKTFKAAGDANSAFFYAKAANSLFSRDNVYWLTIAAGTPMLTVAVAGDSSGGQSFVDRKHLEVDAFAATVVATDPDSDYWYWSYLVGDSATDGQRSFGVELADPVASGNADLTVHLKGATATGVADEHQAEIRVNGTTVGQTSWQGISEHDATLSFPASLLVPGANTIDIVATIGPGAPHSVYYVNSFDLVSPRRLRTSDARLEFVGGTTAAVQVSGFRGGDIALVDVTNADNPRWVTGGKVARSADGFGLIFHPTGANRRYLAESLAAVRRPTSMEIDVPSNLKGSRGAQYVVISDDELAGEASALASYRAGQGLTTMVVRLQDIYDEFDYGIGGPQALRDFLAFAWNEWPQPPRYVTFAGEGTFDYRNNIGLGGNKVPALMVSTTDGLFSSDAAYGDVDGDGVPEIAVGRLPVLSPVELAAVRDKIVAYESAGGDWVDRALFVADNVDGGSNFSAESDELEAILPAEFTVGKVYLDSLSAPAAHDAIVAAFQTGTNYVQYVGHGGLDRFADESLLANSDVSALANGGRAPFVAALTCAVNRFELPQYPALGEELVRRADGGATAVFAPSGLGYHGAAREFAIRLASTVYRQGTERVGDILLSAEREYVDAGGDAELLRIYNLLGDAALRLRLPTPVPPGPGPTSGE